MDNFGNNEIKIANYLENKMSPAEERSFMDELDKDDELRKQYEDELLVRALLNEKDAADEEMPAPILKTVARERKLKTRIVPIRRTYWFAAAAAVILLIAGSAVFEIITRKPLRPDDRPGVAGTHPPDTSKSNPLAQGEKQKTIDAVPTLPKNAKKESKTERTDDILATGHGADSEKLFAEFYTAYPLQNRIPKELAVFYSDYQVGNYDAVIAATEADYLHGDDPARNPVLKKYMELFKGLSYLVKDESLPDKALKQFNLVMYSSAKTDALFYDAQWYRALALLKMDKTGNVDKLSEALKDISGGVSPYATKAAALQQRLGGR